MKLLEILRPNLFIYVIPRVIRVLLLKLFQIGFLLDVPLSAHQPALQISRVQYEFAVWVLLIELLVELPRASGVPIRKGIKILDSGQKQSVVLEVVIDFDADTSFETGIVNTSEAKDHERLVQ